MQKIDIILNSNNVQKLSEFTELETKYINFRKEAYFVRLIGCSNESEYQKSILAMDKELLSKKKQTLTGYMRVSKLNSNIAFEKVNEYTRLYEEWCQISKTDYDKYMQLAFPFRFINDMWEWTCKSAFLQAVESYKSVTKNCTTTMVRNFVIKMFWWMEEYFEKLFLDTRIVRRFPKFVYCGDIKEQEYLFLYFLVQVGCDILYLNPLHDIGFVDDELLNLSMCNLSSILKDIKIPLYDEIVLSSGLERDRQQLPKTNQTIRDMEESPRDRRDTVSIMNEDSGKAGWNVRDRGEDVPNHQSNNREGMEKENGILEYEELAQLASSVVMIGVYNGRGECFKTGSGVLINSEGFILTNFHVVDGGVNFSVRLEEEKDTYNTSELVKYNQINDLALLKIDCNRRPIKVYQGSKQLVRGQKVVAIGSPLGLFNSVSNGIIAGFRSIDEVSMVQFTAPISNGSSGGALLDLYGRLVGIITAGFDDGQNLNLAVDYQTVLTFIKGFIRV